MVGCYGLIALLAFIDVACIAVALRKRREAVDWFSPDIVIPAFFFLFYVVPSLHFVRGQDFFTLETVTRFYVGTEVPESAKEKALAMAIVGFLAILGGIHYYRRVVEPLMRRRNHSAVWRSTLRWSAVYFRAVVACYGLLGCIWTGALLYSLGGIRTVLSNPAGKFALLEGRTWLTLGYMFFAAISVMLLLRHRRVTVGFLLALVLTLVAEWPLVNRGQVIVFLLTVVFIYHYWVRRVGIRQIVLLSSLVALITFGYRIAQEFVGYGSVVLTTLGNTGSVLGALWHHLVGDILIGPQQLGVIVDAVPGSLPYQMGKTILGVGVSLIPKSLYPEKPMVSACGIVAQSLFPRLFAAGTTIPPGLIGEFYLNFGWVGVVTGMFVTGVVIGASYSLLRRSKKPLRVFLHALVMSALLYQFRGEFLTLNRYLVFYVLFWFALRSSARESATCTRSDGPAQAVVLHGEMARAYSD